MKKKSYIDDVIIVVPVYKTSINELEQISLIQLNNILGKYDICFVAPKALKKLTYNIYGYRIEYFTDEYFYDIPSYSRMLMSEEFYKRFVSYEYMLIYQLDAFVFSDKIGYYCDLNYDYIGAPHPRHNRLWGELGLVGNGGLSLRKIDSCLKVVNKVDEIIAAHPLKKQMIDAEDLFFAYCGKRENVSFKVPKPRVAMRFSISNDSYHSLDSFDRNENFGCHGWYKSDYGFWKNIIESCGYVLPELDNFAKRSSRNEMLRYALVRRLVRNDNLCETREMLKAFLDKGSYVVWGGGVYGKRVIDFLLSICANIKCIYDKNPALNKYREIPIRRFEDEEIKSIDAKIIIASKKYTREMKSNLIALGKSICRDFIIFQDIESELILDKYGINFGYWSKIEPDNMIPITSHSDGENHHFF